MLSEIMNWIQRVKALAVANIWYILMAVALGYYIKYRYMDPYLERIHVEASYEEAMAPERVEILHEDEHRVREKQQEEAQRQALIAKEKARKKKLEEMQQRVIRVQKNNGGQRLGGGSGILKSH